MTATQLNCEHELVPFTPWDCSPDGKHSPSLLLAPCISISLREYQRNSKYKPYCCKFSHSKFHQISITANTRTTTAQSSCAEIIATSARLMKEYIVKPWRTQRTLLKGLHLAQFWRPAVQPRNTQSAVGQWTNHWWRCIGKTSHLRTSTQGRNLRNNGRFPCIHPRQHLALAALAVPTKELTLDSSTVQRMAVPAPRLWPVISKGKPVWRRRVGSLCSAISWSFYPGAVSRLSMFWNCQENEGTWPRKAYLKVDFVMLQTRSH